MNTNDLKSFLEVALVAAKRNPGGSLVFDGKKWVDVKILIESCMHALESTNSMKHLIFATNCHFSTVSDKSSTAMAVYQMVEKMKKEGMK